MWKCELGYAPHLAKVSQSSNTKMAALTPHYKVRETILDISHKQHKWSEWENCVLVKLLLKVVYVDMYFGGACAFAGNVAIFLNIVYFGGTIYIMVEKNLSTILPVEKNGKYQVCVTQMLV